MKLYDTMTKEKKDFIPINGKRINLFVCGPTVYDYSHIGHARTYIFFDTLSEYLRYKGYVVFYLQNITDIDDKIIKKANESGTNASEISRFYYRAYIEDMLRLRISGVNFYAPATFYIKEIIDQVKRLIDKGYAYETEDGIYFDISKFPEYGKLSHQSLESIKAGARIEINERKKILQILCYGKRENLGNHTGIHHGARVDLVGILRIQPLRNFILVLSTIYMEVVQI